MEEWDLEEEGTGAAPQLTPFQQEVLNAVAAHEHKFTARALTDFVRGTVGQVSRALDALCDADIVKRGGSGADELLDEAVVRLGITLAEDWKRRAI